MAPELIVDEITQKLDKCDIFSLGVLLFNLISGGKYPFKNSKDQTY